MKISVNWLRNYVNLPDQNDWQAFGDLFTVRTAEVEEVSNLAESFDKMVVGQIESIQPHPNADKLKITKTRVGQEVLQIVCGGSNLYEGQKVAVALVGAKVRWHGEGDLVELEPVKIRGEESFGMICAASEIGLKDEIAAPTGDARRVANIAAATGIMDLSYLKDQPGTPLAVALKKNDIIIDIENKTLTHRPDLWGHFGIAREIAAITGETLKPVEYFRQYDQTLPEIVKVRVKDPDLCPRYLAVTIDNIKIGPSPEWLKTALENTGNRSINNIVDATNFVMLELGNPLHAFDTNTIEGGLIVRRAKAGEMIETLELEKKELDTDTLIIADNKKPLAIAGIKGGLHSGITDHTTRITLEAANFNPVSIRKSSVRLGIRTEAVQRFEKDLDPLLAEQAMDRLVKIILDLCPEATVISRKQDVCKFKYKVRKIKLDLQKASSKIGVEIAPKTAAELLEKLEFKVKSGPGKNSITVEVPSFRATKDINHQDDLVEEIARLYGYEKIPASIPELHIRPAPRLHTERREKYEIRNILSLELGMNETLNYSFYSLKTLQNCGLDESNHLKIRNYLSEEQTHLRTNLLPGLLHNVSQNLKNFDRLKIYELGRTYKLVNSFFPLEEKDLAGLIVVGKKDQDQPFYQVKTAIEILLKRLNITSLKYRKAESPNPLAHPAKHAAWFDFKSQQELIQIFDLHPEVAQNFGLEKQQIACFTINYSLLHKLDRAERRYRSIPKFPSIQIDVSMLVDANREVGEFEKVIRKADPNLISSVKLFDFYQGANIPSDKKSLAYQITLQAADRTLTDEEMKKIQQGIFSNLQALGAEIRGL